MAFPKEIEGEESWSTNWVEQLTTTTKMEEQLSRQDHSQTRMSITPPEFWTVSPSLPEVRRNELTQHRLHDINEQVRTTLA